MDQSWIFFAPGYPQQVQEEAGYHHGFMYFGISFGAIESMVAAAVGEGSYRFHKEKAESLHNQCSSTYLCWGSSLSTLAVSSTTL